MDQSAEILAPLVLLAVGPLLVRRSVDHWSQLHRTLTSFERAVEACARLDAHRPVDGRIGDDHEGLFEFNRQLWRLRSRIDNELVLVTAERLRADLEYRKLRAAGALTWS